MKVSADNTEIVFLRQFDGEHPLTTMWLCNLVDMGISFAYDDRYELPETLPAEPGTIKIVVIHADDWDRYESALGDTLAHYRAAGVTVFKWSPLGDGGTRIREAWTRMDIEMVLTEQDVELDNPAARTRLQNRDFWQLLDENRTHLSQQMASSERKDEPWGDPHTWGVLEPFYRLAKLEPDGGWDEQLINHVDRIIVARNHPPEFASHVSGMAVIARLGVELERQDYLAFAHRQVTHVAKHFPRYEGMPVNRRPGQACIPRTEALSFFLPSFAAVAQTHNDPTLLEDAFSVYDIAARYCFEPQNQLWYHGGRADWRCPVVWGRGVGWALTGIVGFLEWLPTEHPRFEEVKSMFQTSVAALAIHQTDEGMWRNVVDHPQSRPDMSATSLIGVSLATGLRQGWLAPELAGEMLEKSWRAQRGRLFRNRACTTTEGTSVGRTLQFYLSRLHHNCGAAYALHAGAGYEHWQLQSENR